MPTVDSAVATKVGVSLGTSLFIGVATAITFSIGGAMFAAVAPGLDPVNLKTCYRTTADPTLYTDVSLTTVATGECGVVKIVSDKPLAITDVRSVVNSAPMWFGQNYKFLSGNTNFGTWDAFYLQDGSASVAALPLSIVVTNAGVGVTVAPDVLYLETDLGKLNVCLPEVTTQKTFYVGSSGTVYDDAALTKRSTPKSCASLLSRAATPTNITQGARLMNSGYIGLSRASGNDMGSFSDMGFRASQYETVPLGYKAPLRLLNQMGYMYPAPTFPYTTPADILTLVTNSGTLNLCFPSRTYADSSDQGYLFVGNDGSLYKDALLTLPVESESCTSILSRAVTPTSVSNGWRLMNSGYIAFSRSSGYTGELGAFSDTGFNSYNIGAVLAGTKAPLRITYTKPGMMFPEPTYPFSTPSDVLTLATNDGTLNLCFPSRTYESSEFAYYYLFAGKDGSLYTDAFLTKRVTTEACSSILARAATPTSITNAWRSENSGYVSFRRSAKYSGDLGYFTSYGFSPQALSDLPSNSKSPLQLMYAMASLPDHPLPYTTPADVLSLETNSGILSLCFPSWTQVENTEWYHYLFAGKDGTLYNDAHLTKPATSKSCASILAQGYTPSSMIGASVTEPEFKYWGIDFTRALYVQLGNLYGVGPFNAFAPVDARLQAPLQLIYSGNGLHGQADLPAHTVTVQTNLGSKTICSPVMHIGQDENGYPKAPAPLYVDKNGSTYNDILLTSLARACP